HEEITQLRAQLKAQDKEIRRLKESLINSATHLHTSALSSRRRQILDVAPLRLRFTLKPQEVKPKAQIDWLVSGKGGAQCPQSGRLCV
ncbi:MAG: hypothetical protein ACFNY0_04735, partial [Selenomonas sp.]